MPLKMLTIPTQLQNPDFRFILVQEKDKRPLENYWQCHLLKEAQEKWECDKAEADKNNKPFKKAIPERVAQYRFDEPIFLEHLEKGGNYGIVC
jgi:hypothetical protein